MGIFCMVFGAVMFLGFTGGGVLFANALNTPVANFGGQSLAVFVGLPATPAPYIAIGAFIVFLIGLSFFMKGLTYQKVCRIANRRSRRPE